MSLEREEEADFVKAGDVLVLEGDPWEILVASHHGEGTPGVFYVQWVVLALRNLLSGAQSSLRLSLGSPVALTTLEAKTMQFLYAGNGGLHFMDASTFEHVAVPVEHVPHLVGALRAGELVEAKSFRGRPLPHTMASLVPSAI